VCSQGDDSDLHIIIFDEIDAVCKQRGSVRDGSGVHDTVVNQLLTKIDGVDALNNILLIGMTNRRVQSCLFSHGREILMSWLCLLSSDDRVRAASLSQPITALLRGRMRQGRGAHGSARIPVAANHSNQSTDTLPSRT
jgi:hypothetical protein